MIKRQAAPASIKPAIWPTGIRYDHPLSKDLIGYWPFNEGSGIGIHDVSGFGHHGTITDIDATTEWIRAQKEQGLLFKDDIDKTGSIDVGPINFPITNDTSHTFLAIASHKADASRWSYSTLYNHQNLGDVNGDLYMLVGFWPGSATARLYNFDKTQADLPIGVFNDEQPHLFAYVRRGGQAASTDEFYLDDTQLTTVVRPGSRSYDAPQYSVIGNRGSGNNLAWHGALFTVALWSRSLSPEEINEFNRNPWILTTPRKKLFLSIDVLDDNSSSSSNTPSSSSSSPTSESSLSSPSSNTPSSESSNTPSSSSSSPTSESSPSSNTPSSSSSNTPSSSSSSLTSESSPSSESLSSPSSNTPSSSSSSDTSESSNTPSSSSSNTPSSSSSSPTSESSESSSLAQYAMIRRHPDIAQVKPQLWSPGLRYDHPLSQGLVGYWPFWEGGSNTIHDISGFGHHGTMLGDMSPEDWVKEERGLALEFDGVNDTVFIGNRPVLKLQSLSVVVRFKVNSPITARKAIIGRGEFLGFGTKDWNIGILNTSPARLYWEADGWQFFTPFTQAGEWVTAVGTWDGSTIANHVRLYVNGVLLNTGISSAPITNEFNLTMGSGTASTENPFDGQIDFAAIWNRALTANEVLELQEDPFALITPRKKVYLISGAPEDESSSSSSNTPSSSSSSSNTPSSSSSSPTSESSLSSPSSNTPSSESSNTPSSSSSSPTSESSLSSPSSNTPSSESSNTPSSSSSSPTSESSLSSPSSNTPSSSSSSPTSVSSVSSPSSNTPSSSSSSPTSESSLSSPSSNTPSSTSSSSSSPTSESSESSNTPSSTSSSSSSPTSESSESSNTPSSSSSSSSYHGITTSSSSSSSSPGEDLTTSSSSSSSSPSSNTPSSTSSSSSSPTSESSVSSASSNTPSSTSSSSSSPTSESSESSNTPSSASSNTPSSTSSSSSSPTSESSESSNTPSSASSNTPSSTSSSSSSPTSESSLSSASSNTPSSTSSSSSSPTSESSLSSESSNTPSSTSSSSSSSSSSGSSSSSSSTSSSSSSSNTPSSTSSSSSSSPGVVETSSSNSSSSSSEPWPLRYITTGDMPIGPDEPKITTGNEPIADGNGVIVLTGDSAVELGDIKITTWNKEGFWRN